MELEKSMKLQVRALSISQWSDIEVDEVNYGGYRFKVKLKNPRTGAMAIITDDMYYRMRKEGLIRVKPTKKSLPELKWKGTSNGGVTETQLVEVTKESGPVARFWVVRTFESDTTVRYAAHVNMLGSYFQHEIGRFETAIAARIACEEVFDEIYSQD